MVYDMPAAGGGGHGHGLVVVVLACLLVALALRQSYRRLTDSLKLWCTVKGPLVIIFVTECFLIINLLGVCNNNLPYFTFIR